MTRLLIFGRRGQLARALGPALAGRRGLDCRFVGRPEVDLADPAAAAAAIGASRPAIVVNAAAFTDVDGAETAPEAAFAINRDAVAEMATACARHGAALIHLSTDYVFGGRATRPYAADDPVDPINVYGASKAAGEARVRDILADHLILRTSWLFGGSGHNFVRTMLRLAAERAEIAVVDDQIAAPTSADALAAAIAEMAARLADGGAGRFGTYHYTGGDPLTRLAFAEAICDRAARDGWPRPQLRAIDSAAFGAAAPRPFRSVLDCGAIATEWGIAPEPWRRRLPATVATIFGDLRAGN